MSIKAYITDIGRDIKASVDDGGGSEKNALVVASRPLKEFNNRPFYFITSEGSKDMNVNVTFGGVPEKVHDGIDSVLWTGSSIIGTSVTFNSALQNHTAAGATSVQVDNASVGDVVQLAKGSDLNCGNYSAMTLWIYVDKDWIPGDEVELYGWDTGTSLQVGTAINLEEYFDYSILDVWQKIAIGLDDFGDLASSTTLDSLRLKIVDKAGIKSPKFYLDDIQFEETGKPLEFVVEPKAGTWLYITSFDIIIVDVYDATLTDSSMPKISHSGFLGLSSLTIGIQARRIGLGTTMFTAVFKDLIDFMGLPGMQIVGHGSDGTNTWIKISQRMATPVILKSDDGDRFTYIVRDDLSGLKKLWISVACYEEVR